MSSAASALASRRWKKAEWLDPKKRTAFGKMLSAARQSPPSGEPVLDLDGLASTFNRPRQLFEQAVKDGRLPAKTEGQGTKRWVAVVAAAEFLKAHDAVESVKQAAKK